MPAAHDHADREEQQDDAARDLQRRQGDVEDPEQHLAGKDEHQRDDGRRRHRLDRDLPPEVRIGCCCQRRVNDQSLQRPDRHQEHGNDVEDAELHGRVRPSVGRDPVGSGSLHVAGLFDERQGASGLSQCLRYPPNVPRPIPLSISASLSTSGGRLSRTASKMSGARQVSGELADIGILDTLLFREVGARRDVGTGVTTGRSVCPCGRGRGARYHQISTTDAILGFHGSRRGARCGSARSAASARLIRFLLSAKVTAFMPTSSRRARAVVPPARCGHSSSAGARAGVGCPMHAEARRHRFTLMLTLHDA